ncbi:MAG: diacylglycerol kinase [Candidatus Magasanikbacteria bacterium]|nr:diacylglycerol kinase [Candidatus Magasanikbacteria bacterium]
MFHFRKIMRSFHYALKGLFLIFKEEQSFRVQVVAAVVVVVIMFVFPTKNWEKVALILVTSWVLVLELINSILERMADILKPRMHLGVEAVKDIMAAAVFIASFTALIIGLIIFIPYVRS